MGLTTITVISVGIYLWYNFNARSRLVLVVPSTAEWYLHVQTKMLRADFAETLTPPAEIESLRKTVGSLPIFSSVKDAGEPGIALYSDLVAFGLPEGRCVALSLTSEERFKSFLQALKKRNLLKGGIDKGRYFYAESNQGKLYVAFKYKALVLFKPWDSLGDYHVAEQAFEKVFAKKTHTFMQKPEVQALYEGEPEVVYYAAQPQYGLSQSVDFPTLTSQNQLSEFVKFNHLNKVDGKYIAKSGASVSPLMLVAKVHYPAKLEACIDAKNRMTAHTALGLMAGILNQQIKESNQ